MSLGKINIKLGTWDLDMVMKSDLHVFGFCNFYNIEFPIFVISSSNMSSILRPNQFSKTMHFRHLANWISFVWQSIKSCALLKKISRFLKNIWALVLSTYMIRRVLNPLFPWLRLRMKIDRKFPHRPKMPMTKMETPSNQNLAYFRTYP